MSPATLLGYNNSQPSTFMHIGQNKIAKPTKLPKGADRNNIACHV
jgi:hypothetical protein